MSALHSVPEHVQRQITALTPTRRRQLPAAIKTCIAAVETLQQVKLDGSHLEEWPTAKQTLECAVKELGGIAALVPILDMLAEEGPDGQRGRFRVPPKAWPAYVMQARDKVIQDLTAILEAVTPKQQRRRSRARRLTEITSGQIDAVTRVAAHKSIAAAARAAKVSRAAMSKRFNKAIRKAPDIVAAAKKGQTKSLPTDKRGQIVVADKKAPAHTRPTL